MIPLASLRRLCLSAPLVSVALCTRAVPATAQVAHIRNLVVTGSAQVARELPFAPGERFEYAGRVHVGVAGKGSIWVEGSTEVRGTPTWTLHSEMEGRLGFLRATDKTTSWLDPIRFASLRYTSEERHLLARHDETVDIFPAERRWRGEGGSAGTTETDAPLDALSFLFYLRTLPLRSDAPLTVSRHFDTARNPTIVTVEAQ